MRFFWGPCVTRPLRIILIYDAPVCRELKQRENMASQGILTTDRSIHTHTHTRTLTCFTQRDAAELTNLITKLTLPLCGQCRTCTTSHTNQSLTKSIFAKTTTFD